MIRLCVLLGLPCLSSGLTWSSPGRHVQAAPARQDVWVVVSVNSGRRDRMSVLLQYLDQLVARGDVDEVDFMLIDQKAKPEDRLWVSSLKRLGPAYHVHDVPNYTGVYAFFANEWRAPSSCRPPCEIVWVKMDDDIVYVDVPRFGEFVRYAARQRGMFLVHANIVNHGVTAYYQELAGATPTGLHFEYPLMPRGPNTPDIMQAGSGGTLWRWPTKAVALHQEFVCDPASFAWDSTENGGCLVYDPPVSDDAWSPGWGQGRFSVNFFATRFENLQTVLELSHRTLGPTEDDEEGLTALSNRTQCFFTRFNVAHLSYANQHSIDEQVLPWYASAAARDRLCQGSKQRIP